MKIIAKTAISVMVILGGILFSNFINDFNVSLSSTLGIVLIYQFIVIFIGAGILLLVERFSSEQPNENEATDQLTTDHDISEIITDGHKVVGTYGGSDITEFVTVKYNDGREVILKFDTTLDQFSTKHNDESHLNLGSIILQPGIVYVPVE